MLIYNVALDSFSYFPDALGAGGTTLTNIINDWNGDLIYGVNNSGDLLLKTFDLTDRSSASPKIVTKQMDFGNIRVKKNIYTISITHRGKGATATILLSYSTDGGTTWVTTDGNSSAMNLADNATLIPQVFTLDVEDKYSMIIKLETSVTVVDSDFEIDEISIVYRPKVLA